MENSEISIKEKTNSGTSWTRNEEFDKNGFFVIKNLCNPEQLYHPVPNERGMIKYFGSVDRYEFSDEEQVPGSLARYSHPQYKKFHTSIRLAIENQIGRKLYNTYYYDRFYFTGQELKKHVDREACEISATVHIGTNITECWPIKIKSPDTYSDIKKTNIIEYGKENSICLNPGDAVIYKGCERPHWRDPMPEENKKKSIFN